MALEFSFFDLVNTASDDVGTDLALDAGALEDDVEFIASSVRKKRTRASAAAM